MAKILLIDDTVFFRKMYCDFLHNSGYEVVEASDGIEGIQKAQEAQPDLILLDLSMPRLNGLNTLERLKEDKSTSHIEVIVLSARERTDDVKEAIKKGAIDYLVKTVNKPGDVVGKINHALQQTTPETTSRSENKPTSGTVAKSYQIFLRDGEGDADNLASDCELAQRFWCPNCQKELILELVPDSTLPSNNGHHHFKAELICAHCGNQF